MMLNHCELRHLFQKSIFYPSLKYSVGPPIRFPADKCCINQIFFFKDQALNLCFYPNFSPRPSVFLLWNSLNDINSCFRHLDDTMDSLQWMCSSERQLPYRTIEPAFALCLFFSLSCPYSNAN